MHAGDNVTNSAFKVPPAQVMKVRDIKFKTSDLLTKDKNANTAAVLLDKKLAKSSSAPADKKKALVKTG